MTTLGLPPVSAFRLPRRPKAVVFDLDGTLIDSEALVLEAYMAAADRHGVPFTHAPPLVQLASTLSFSSSLSLNEYSASGLSP